MKYYSPIIIMLILLTVQCNSQKLTSTPEKIETAKKELNPTIRGFNNSIVNSDLENCIATLLGNADNEYKKYLIGGLLYNIEKDKSYQLHKEAYLSKPDELNFNLEYAIELHRKGEYEEAAKLYEGYAKEKIEDFRVNVWLADCYINTGNIQLKIGRDQITLKIIYPLMTPLISSMENLIN